MPYSILPNLCVFFGSFLLFVVQPMLGRTLLPSFGGSAAVWTVCLASFQTLLLAGYLYAFFLSKCPRRVQAALHTWLLILGVFWATGFACLRLVLQSHLGGSHEPALAVLFCVFVFVGLPYVLLASGSTLTQKWLEQTRPHSVYRLYAVSNLGSFCGLLSYPFVFEPFVSVSAQWWGFAACLLAYAGVMACVAKKSEVEDQRSEIRSQRSGEHGQKDESLISDLRLLTSAPWLWFVLPALSTFLLNAVTTHLTLDVAPLPLLWVGLLGLFLLSYVVGFSGFTQRMLPLFFFLSLGFALFAILVRNKTNGGGGEYEINLAACAGLCFFGSTFMHSWLYHVRPGPKQLPLFYLGIAAGGAVGGLLASLVAPLLFKTLTEFPIALTGVALAGLTYVILARGPVTLRWAGAAIACCTLVVVGFAFQPKQGDWPTVLHDRDFFGTIWVTETKAKSGTSSGVIREFVHGSTVHGIQVSIPGKERLPTTYYTPENCGFAVLAHPKYRSGEPMRVNLLGLGVGVMLCYARSNDYYRCYEISSNVLRTASNPALFTFISGCPGRVDLVCQDARKGLEQELAAGAEKYDVIVFDAFAGDNLPYHLCTREAFELYFKMLKPDGILAVNISNWHLDLTPFVMAVSRTFNCPILAMETKNDFARLSFAAKTAFYCRQPEGLGPLPAAVRLMDLRNVPNIPMPTDEKGSFVSAIRW